MNLNFCPINKNLDSSSSKEISAAATVNSNNVTSNFIKQSPPGPQPQAAAVPDDRPTIRKDYLSNQNYSSTTTGITNLNTSNRKSMPL